MQPENRNAAILEGVRRRGQFLVSALLWAGAAGFSIMAAGWLVFFYHHALSVGERARSSLGFHAPAGGPDWFVLAVLAIPPVGAALAVLWAWSRYRAVWNRRLAETWPGGGGAHSAWTPLRMQGDSGESARRDAYVRALLASPGWSTAGIEAGEYKAASRAVFKTLETEILERAFTTGLIVGVSSNRWVDTLTIFASALELQLHVMTRLGKRPSLHAWRLLLQQCGASLFVNSYLTRQDAMLVSLAIKKSGIGLHAVGDAMDTAATSIADHDLDLDDLLHLNKLDGVPLIGLATKSMEIAATMAFTVGKQGMYALGNLIESVGDELAQGAIAAAILYHHGVALAADTLALDQEHRRDAEFNPNFAQGLGRMTALAGKILLDAVRQRRDAFRERRGMAIRRLPRAATEGIRDKLSSLFGGDPAKGSGA